MFETPDRRPPVRLDVPPGPRRPGRQLIKVLPGTQFEYICLSHRVLGVLIHYVEGRSEPCSGDSCPFDHGSVKEAARWQGWLAVQARPSQPIQYLPVTQGAADENPCLVDHGYSLRGCQLITGRAGAAVTTRKIILTGVQFWEDRAIAPAPDVRRFLARLWNIDASRLAHLPDHRWGAGAPPIRERCLMELAGKAARQ